MTITCKWGGYPLAPAGAMGSGDCGEPMRIVIHGGMHKTGTTSLQAAMFRSREALRPFGIVYPGSELQHAGLLNPRRPGWQPEVLAAAVAEGIAAGAEVLFLSAEVFSTLSAAEMARIRGALGPHEVRIVFCFRHWNGYLPSRWAQNIRRRDTQGFRDYVVAIGGTPWHVDLHHGLVLERAKTVDAEVVALSFDRAVHSDEGLVRTLLRAAGPVAEAVELAHEATTIANEQLEWREREVYRLLNGIVADARRLPQDDLCRSVAETRLPASYFDLHRCGGLVPEEVWNELRRVMEAHREDIAVTDLPGVAPAEAELEVHRGLFSNVGDGSIFPSPPPRSLTTTDLDWRRFGSLYGSLAMRALQGMGLARAPV